MFLFFWLRHARHICVATNMQMNVYIHLHICGNVFHSPFTNILKKLLSRLLRFQRFKFFFGRSSGGIIANYCTGDLLYIL